jgi:hypothetical protein
MVPSLYALKTSFAGYQTDYRVNADSLTGFMFEALETFLKHTQDDFARAALTF